MPILAVILVLAVIGVALYAFNQVVAVDQKIKIIINALVVIAVLFWLAGTFGLISPRFLHAGRIC